MKLNKKSVKKEVEQIEPKEDQEESNDWDFDFTRYEHEEKLTEDSLTSITDKKPRISNYMSKYGASIETIQLLTNMRTTASDAAIKVASRSGDMKDIRNLYGCLNEMWAIIKDIYGSAILNEINNLDRVIVKNIQIAQKKAIIPDKLYEQLLLYRDKIYMLIQRAKLGFEVEKSRGSAFQKARKGMIE